MKRHPGWLAAGLLLAIVLACNVSKNFNYSTTFAPSDRKVHCVVTFNKTKPATKIRLVWMAENVEGRSKHSELDSIDHITDVDEERSDFHLTWSRHWRPGTYRVEIYIDGILDKTIDYTVE